MKNLKRNTIVLLSLFTLRFHDVRRLSGTTIEMYSQYLGLQIIMVCSTYFITMFFSYGLLQ